MTQIEADAWDVWRKYVLKELERLNLCFENLAKGQNDINIRLTKLETKAGVWGGLAGTIGATLVGVIFKWVLN